MQNAYYSEILLEDSSVIEVVHMENVRQLRRKGK